MGEPMVQDRGIAGLEQSMHHPLAGYSQYNLEVLCNSSEAATTQQGDTDETTVSLEQRLLAYIQPGDREAAVTLLRAIIDTIAIRIAVSTPIPLQTSPSDDEPVIVSQLKAIL